MSSRSASWEVTASVTLLVAGLLGLAGLQYLMPATFDNPAGANVDGVRHFARALFGRSVGELSLPAFVWSFRLLLAVSWIGYVLVLLAGISGARVRASWMLPLVIALPLAYALVFPPSLSRDAYAYVGFARVALAGDNPYLHTLKSLADRGDDAAAFHPIDAASTYGPLFTLMSGVVVAAFRSAGLLGQVVAVKLVAAAATIVAAFAAREITRVYEPARADLTLLAVGLNPLLLIEGPGNGHNDCVMMGLMLAALALHARKKPNRAYVVLGSSAAIKFVSAAVAPWLVLDDMRDRPVRRALVPFGTALALVLAPMVLAFLPFWSGAITLRGIQRVYEIQTTNPSAAGMLLRLGATAFLYALLTVWLWRTRVPGRHLAAWSIFALALPFLALPTWFAWYVLWSSCVSLTRWDRTHLWISAACVAVSLLHLSLYAAPVAP